MCECVCARARACVCVCESVCVWGGAWLGGGVHVGVGGCLLLSLLLFVVSQYYFVLLSFVSVCVICVLYSIVVFGFLYFLIFISWAVISFRVLVTCRLL